MTALQHYDIIRQDILTNIGQINTIYKSSYIYNENQRDTVLGNSDTYTTNSQMNINIDTICNIVKECLVLYNRLDENYKRQNNKLNIELVKCLFNYLVYIYQYYIIVQDYEEYKKTNTPSAGTAVSRASKRQKTSQSSQFYDFIDNHIKTQPLYATFDEIINDQKTYLKFIIYRLNIEILAFNHKPVKDLTLIISFTYKIEPDETYKDSGTFNAETNDATHILSNLTNYIRSFRLVIIGDIFMLPNDNKIILIPQYQGICWFVSMITALSYSDMNRELIISKIPNFGTVNSSSNEFKDFIHYIIRNIKLYYVKDVICERCNM